MRRIRWNPRVIAVGALAAWQILVIGMVTIGVWNNPVHRAVLGMGWGLLLLWVAVCGLSMLFWRERINQLAARVPIPWGLKFVPFLFVPLVAILAPWLWLTAKHPEIHFPPIVGN